MIYKIKKNCDNNAVTVSDILYVATVYNSLVTGFINRREQLVNYDWLKQEEVSKLIDKFFFF